MKNLKNKNVMTAVEWLVETINKKYINAFLSRVIEQAKEMEKAQIIDAVDYGKNHSYDYSEDNEVDYYNAEQYYNEKFKK